MIMRSIIGAAKANAKAQLEEEGLNVGSVCSNIQSTIARWVGARGCNSTLLFSFFFTTILLFLKPPIQNRRHIHSDISYC